MQHSTIAPGLPPPFGHGNARRVTHGYRYIYRFPLADRYASRLWSCIDLNVSTASGPFAVFGCTIRHRISPCVTPRPNNASQGEPCVRRCSFIAPLRLQVMAKYLWSHMTPWLRRDVEFVTHVEETFQRSPFLALHIRRGDKITQGEAKAIDVEVRYWGRVRRH